MSESHQLNSIVSVTGILVVSWDTYCRHTFLRRSCCGNGQADSFDGCNEILCTLFVKSETGWSRTGNDD